MARHDEDFELVLGNKQLLSLFFVVVFFFAAFFSVGYGIGFGHGEQSAEGPELAGLPDPAPEDDEESTFPAALYKSGPKPVDPTPVTTEAAEPPEEKPAPVAAKATEAEKPKPTVAPPTPKPEKPAPVKTAAAKPAPAATLAPATGEYFLQVAAVRVAKDAEALTGQLVEKGYPARAEAGGEWNRVLVGPFASSQAAESFRGRLKKDGFDTMLRKR